MSTIEPGTSDFVTQVYGTVFAARAQVVDRLRAGDVVILVPDPPDVDDPTVWAHAAGGDVIGHLSPDVSRWLAPAMFAGRRCRAEVHTVAAPGTASWKRLQLHVRCLPDDDAAGD